MLPVKLSHNVFPLSPFPSRSNRNKHGSSFVASNRLVSRPKGAAQNGWPQPARRFFFYFFLSLFTSFISTFLPLVPPPDGRHIINSAAQNTNLFSFFFFFIFLCPTSNKFSSLLLFFSRAPGHHRPPLLNAGKHRWRRKRHHSLYLRDATLFVFTVIKLRSKDIRKFTFFLMSGCPSNLEWIEVIK